MIDRVAIDTAFLRLFCLGREDDATIDNVVGDIARKCPEAYELALRLGPWVHDDPDDLLVSIVTPPAAPSWLH